MATIPRSTYKTPFSRSTWTVFGFWSAASGENRGGGIQSCFNLDASWTLARNMAGSKYAYVKNFELADNLLPNTFLVVRIDGHGFHR